MPSHSKGRHHYEIRRRIHEKHEPFPHPDKTKRIIDRVIYIVAFLGPLMNLPQLIKIWMLQDATGVSLVSWVGFAVLSVVWLIYGVAHNEKPIILMNFLLLIVQIVITIGIFTYGSGLF